MAINIKFDLQNNPEPPTIILATRSGKKLGQLNVDPKSISLSDKFNDASEITFTLNKYINGKITNLWDKVVDFKLIYCKEWDMWFEATVELDEKTETIKTVFCKQLGQAELSQIILYNIHINEEGDSNWKKDNEEYKRTILFDEKDASVSLLHRLLKDKAPHYSIAHVDDTIKNEQRTFSFDGVSIYDAFMQIAEEIGCLFIFNSNSDENSKIQRTISVYDLLQYCNDCGHRSEHTNKCSKCNSTNIKSGYGEDTLIFVTSDELATNGIQLTTDTDSVKNCFKLEAGDDLMTSTIRNCNPNGTDYIWYFSDAIKEDMSEELVDKIESYDTLYQDCYNNYESELDANLVSKYNVLIDKYSKYNKELQKIQETETNKYIIKGYSSLMNAYYNTIDLALYLESSLMPSIEMSETSAEEQVKLLTASSLSPVAVANIKSVSLATADSAVLAMAKIIIKSTYKVEVKTSTLTDNGDENETWTGSFIVTNYSDEEDTATSGMISVVVTGDEESFIKQKIEKALNKDNTDNYSISGLFEKDYNVFCEELKKYALNPLVSFRDSAQTCIDILIEQKVGEDETSDLYKKLYSPYLNKLKAIEAEIKIREDEISIIKGVWDKTDENNPILKTDGLQTDIEKCKNGIQNALNFENYLGTELWLEFCSYRREDKYTNENYISDGLNNAELFDKALQFIEVAQNEIYKSAELQHSISTTLNNLLAIPKFKPLVESFSNGNWIRVQVNDEIYKLRLLEYEIEFGSFDNIPVVFSDVTKVKNGITDVESILSQASSMATSYSSVQKQASQGESVKGTVDQWITSGLNSALVNIKNNTNEEVTIDNNGILARSYDEITDTYSPEQLKITHNIMAYTNNNWETVRQAIGKHGYKTYDETNDKWIDLVGYGMTADFVTAGQVMGSTIVGGDIYSDNYSETNGTGSYLNLRDGTFSFAGNRLRFNGDDLILTGVNLSWSDISDAPTKISSFTNDVGYETATSIKNTVITKDYIETLNIRAGSVAAENISGTTISGKTISGGSITIGENFSVDTDGNLEATSTNITGTINAEDGYLRKMTLEGDGYIKCTSISGTTTLNPFGFTWRSGLLDATVDGIMIGSDDNSDGYVKVQNYDGSIYTLINSSGITTTGNLLSYGNVAFSGATLLSGKVDIGGQANVNGTLTVVGGCEFQGRTFLANKTSISSYSSVGVSDGTTTTYKEYRLLRLSGDDEVILGNIETPTIIRGASIVSNVTIDQGSDSRLKHDIKALSQNYIDAFMDLDVVSFRYNANPDKEYVGLIYQDVKKIFENHDIYNFSSISDPIKESAEDENDILAYGRLSYDGIQNIQMKLVQNHEREIASLKEEITELKNIINELKNTLV